MKQQEVKKKQADLLLLFPKLGSRYSMVFTAQEVLSQRIIGLDGIMQKILVLETGSESIDWYLINLKEVRACSLRTMLGNKIRAVSNEENSNDQIETIIIEFSFKTGPQTVGLPFYEASKNTTHELPVLFNKALEWEVILNKMVIAEDQRA